MRNATPPSLTTANRRDGGSIMLLVIVTIVLLVIIGATWLQVTRVQRLSVGDRELYGPIILESVKEEIADQLEKDVFSDRAWMFDEAWGVEPYDYPWTNPDPATSDTDPVVDLNGTSWGTALEGELSDRWLAWTTPTFDSTTPNGRWRHLTSLTGGYYTSDTGSSDLSQVTLADPIQGHALSPATGFHDVDIDDPSLVDSDGDGLGDSRWERAPIPAINGIEYFMAVRIVDLSSMINLKSGMAVDPTGGAWNINLSGRGYYPTDANLGALFAMRTGAAGYEDLAWLLGDDVTRPMAPAPSFLWPKITGTPLRLSIAGMASPIGILPNGAVAAGVGGRVEAWRNDASQPGDLKQWAPTALELLWRGGIDSPITSPVEQALRDSRTDAGGHVDSHPLTMNNSTGNAVPPYNDLQYPKPIDDTTAEDHFHGGNETDPPTARTDFDDNIRHMITTLSGAGVHAPNPGQMHNDNLTNEGGFALKQDLIYQYTGGGPGATPQDRVNAIGERLVATLQLPGLAIPGAPASPRLGDSNYGYGGTDSHALVAAAEYALAIQEYSDTDSTLSAEVTVELPPPVTPGITGTFYGIEKLPFLREVYLQLGYADDGGAGDTAANDGEWEPRLVQDTTAPVPPVTDPLPTPLNNGCGLVIELGNPFDSPIDLTTTPVRIAIYQAGRLVSQYDLSTITAPIPPRGAPDQAEHLLIVSNPVVADAVTDIDPDTPGTPYSSPVTDLPTSLNITAGGNTVEVDDPMITTDDGQKLWFIPDGTNIIVTLETQNAAGAWVAYDRLFDPAFQFPTSVGTTASPYPVPASGATEAHIQMSIKRAGQDIRYLSNVGKAVLERSDAVTSTPAWPDDGFATRAGTAGEPLDDLNLDDKVDTRGGAVNIVGDTRFSTTTGLPSFQIPMADRPLLSVSELGHILMVGIFQVDLDANGLPDDLDGDGFPDGDLPQRLSGNGPAAPLPTATWPIIPKAQWFLNFRENPADVFLDAIDYPIPVTATGIEMGLNYAQLVLEQFTTLSPRHDGEDNDDDGDTDEDGSPTDHSDMPEQLAFGTININTAPRHVISLATPLPEPLAQKEALVAAILEYRDDLSATGRPAMHATPILGHTGYAGRTRPGLRSIGELMFVADGSPPGTMMLYGIDGASQGVAGGGVHDLYPLPEARVANGGTAQGYAIANDNEELLARFQYFPQVFTTRSDIYAAYVLIRGYRTGRFHEGPVETLRSIMIFDRSGLWGSMQGGDPRTEGQVEVLGAWSTEPRARRYGFETYPAP